MRPALLLAIASFLQLAGCKSGPPAVIADAETVLADAENQLEQGAAEGCRDLLLTRDESGFPPSLRPRYEIALAKAHLQLGDPWAAHQVLRFFADNHPHSELRSQAIDLQFEAGSRLSTSHGGFWFFWSDQRRARVVLEHLNTRYPDSAHLDDSLHILGEMAFAEKDFERAEERFRELMRRRPESEWVPLARFRFAMSITGALNGPDYDMEKMTLATKELRAFLADPPENPQFVEEAAAALERLLSWRAERHLRVATFYADVGNRFGEVRHLRQALDPEFAATEAATTAMRRLQELGETVTPPTADPNGQEPR